MSGSARSEQDDRGAAEADGGANQIPAVGLRALDRPQPQQRRGDIDPAIGGIGAPRMVGVDQLQQPGEERERGEAGQQPPRSEERRGGKGWGSTGSSRWSPYQTKKNIIKHH